MYGTLKTTRGLGELDVVPTDSYLVPYCNERTTYFGNVGPPLYLVFENINYTCQAVQDRIVELGNQLESSPWLVHYSEISWYDSYSIWSRAINQNVSYLDKNYR